MEPTPVSRMLDIKAGKIHGIEAPTHGGWWAYQPRGAGSLPQLVFVDERATFYRPELGMVEYAIDKARGRWLGFAGPADLRESARRALRDELRGRNVDAPADVDDDDLHPALTTLAQATQRRVGSVLFREHFGLHPDLRVVVRRGQWHSGWMDAGTQFAGGAGDAGYVGFAVCTDDRYCLLGSTVDDARGALRRMTGEARASVHRLDWSRTGQAAALAAAAVDRDPNPVPVEETETRTAEVGGVDPQRINSAPSEPVSVADELDGKSGEFPPQVDETSAAPVDSSTPPGSSASDVVDFRSEILTPERGGVGVAQAVEVTAKLLSVRDTLRRSFAGDVASYRRTVGDYVATLRQEMERTGASAVGAMLALSKHHTTTATVMWLSAAVCELLDDEQHAAVPAEPAPFRALRLVPPPAPETPAERTVALSPLFDLPVHPEAERLPAMPEAELAELAADIKANGLLEALVIHEGQLLDGRSRREACRRVGVTPHAVQFSGTDPAAYVISKNIHRRHLTPSQRAGIVARAVLAAPPEPAAAGEGKRSVALAEAAQVAPRTLEYALAAAKQGVPELAEAVVAGDVPARVAADIAQLPPARQLEVLRDADPKVLQQISREVRAETKQKRDEKLDARRKERIEQARHTLPDITRAELRLCTVEAALADLQGANIGLVSMDPPWLYDNTGVNGATDGHYMRHATPETFARVVRDLADVVAVDAYLVIWITNPMMEAWFEAAARVREAAGRGWCWTYLTMLTWNKPGRGIGHHAIGDTEHCLVYKRGTARTFGPAPSTRQEEDRGEAEEKPVELQRAIVAAYAAPDGVVLDLYAGRATLGVAAIREGRRYLGIEAAPDRHELGLLRLAEAAPDPRQQALPFAGEAP